MHVQKLRSVRGPRLTAKRLVWCVRPLGTWKSHVNFYHVHCICCVFFGTYDKALLCCVPDIMHMTKIRAHGKLRVSGIDCVKDECTPLLQLATENEYSIFASEVLKPDGTCGTCHDQMIPLISLTILST